ncbi:MAG: 3D domain-containing protein [bacterium]
MWGWIRFRRKRLLFLNLAALALLVSSMVYLWSFKQVTLVVGGRERTLRTRGTTVDAVLEEAGVSVGPNDVVIPSRNAGVFDGMRIEVVKITERIIVRRDPIPHKTRYIEFRRLPRDKSLLIHTGRDGIREVTVRVIYRDGIPIERVTLEDRVILKPLNTTILVGTGRYAADDILSKHAADGEYMEFLTTAYYPGRISTYPSTDGLTAIGLPAVFGVAAVDPTVIPLGTHLYVEGYGYAIAADVGAAIKGKRIDLCFDNLSDAITYGVRMARVYILD